MIVMQPELRQMDVAPMPALNRDFTSYVLEMEKRESRSKRSNGNRPPA